MRESGETNVDRQYDVLLHLSERQKAVEQDVAQLQTGFESLRQDVKEEARLTRVSLDSIVAKIDGRGRLSLSNIIGILSIAVAYSVSLSGAVWWVTNQSAEPLRQSLASIEERAKEHRESPGHSGTVADIAVVVGELSTIAYRVGRLEGWVDGEGRALAKEGERVRAEVDLLLSHRRGTDGI